MPVPAPTDRSCSRLYRCYTNLGSPYCEDGNDNDCLGNDVCVSETCIPKVADGGKCDLKDDEDCQNGSCGKAFYNADEDNYICCPSGKKDRIAAGNYICTELPLGTKCGSHDSFCASGICIEGECVADRRNPGEICSSAFDSSISGDDNDCVGNTPCGKVYPNGELRCCKSGSTSAGWCNNLDAEEACGDENSLCKSGACVNGECKAKLQDVGESCSDRFDCLSASGNPGARPCAHGSYPLGDMVCCADKTVRDTSANVYYCECYGDDDCSSGTSCKDRVCQ